MRIKNPYTSEKMHLWTTVGKRKHLPCLQEKRIFGKNVDSWFFSKNQKKHLTIDPCETGDIGNAIDQHVNEHTAVEPSKNEQA